MNRILRFLELLLPQPFCSPYVQSCIPKEVYTFTSAPDVILWLT